MPLSKHVGQPKLALAHEQLACVLSAVGAAQLTKAQRKTAFWVAFRAYDCRGGDEEFSSSSSEQVDDIEHEVVDRLSCIMPVIAAKVQAAHSGQPMAVPHSKRLRRNVAEHAVFGRTVSDLNGVGLRLTQKNMLNEGFSSASCAAEPISATDALSDKIDELASSVVALKAALVPAGSAGRVFIGVGTDLPLRGSVESFLIDSPLGVESADESGAAAVHCTPSLLWNDVGIQAVIGLSDASIQTFEGSYDLAHSASDDCTTHKTDVLKANVQKITADTAHLAKEIAQANGRTDVLKADIQKIMADTAHLIGESAEPKTLWCPMLVSLPNISTTVVGTGTTANDIECNDVEGNIIGTCGGSPLVVVPMASPQASQGGAMAGWLRPVQTGHHGCRPAMFMGLHLPLRTIVPLVKIQRSVPRAPSMSMGSLLSWRPM